MAEREREDKARTVQEEARKWNTDVAACTRAVNNSGVFGGNSFQAHVPSPGEVKMVGTPKALYTFEKCMNDSGHVVK